MQHCLLTGGTGFLGRYFDSALRTAGFRVVRLVRSSGGPDMIVGDLLDPRIRLPRIQNQIVVHAAGLAHHIPRTLDEQDLFFQVNRDGARNLLTALEATGHLPEAIVFVSTVAVYGVAKGSLISEDAPRQASDAYGASKREAEDLLQAWSAKHSVRLGIMRLPLVVGPGAPGNWRRMVQGIAKQRYWGIGSGIARRSMVCVEDVARVLSRLAQKGGTFHLTDGYHPSLAELEREISKSLRKRCPRRIPISLGRLGALTGDALQRMGMPVPFNSATLSKLTNTLTFSDEKARLELNWSPSIVLDRIGDLVA